MCIRQGILVEFRLVSVTVWHNVYNYNVVNQVRRYWYTIWQTRGVLTPESWNALWHYTPVVVAVSQLLFIGYYYSINTYNSCIQYTNNSAIVVLIWFSVWWLSHHRQASQMVAYTARGGIYRYNSRRPTFARSRSAIGACECHQYFRLSPAKHCTTAVHHQPHLARVIKLPKTCPGA